MSNRSRKKMIYVNTLTTLFTQIVTVLLGFIIRKIFIDTLGVSYLGYNSVFLNILQMLNLADLGIGVAITSFLYKPLADNDTEKINALMYIYKRVYQILGIIVLIFGLITSIFISVLIPDFNGNYSYMRFLFYINLIGTVSTYYLAYKRTLLIADQKSYYATFIDMTIYLGTSILQIIILNIIPNYVLYLIIGVAKNIISNLILSIKCSKEYKYLNNNVNKEILREYKKPIIRYVRDAFVSRIGAYIFYSTDNIIISVFKGSLLTGYLANYTLVTAQVSNIIAQILASVQATFGNFINSEKSLKKQEEMVDNYLCVNYLVGNFCMISVMFLIQPFISLVFGKEYILPFSTVIWLSVNLLLTILIQLPSQLFMIYKLYKYDRIVVAASAILNIIISITLVKKLGIDGVLIGTFVTSLIYLYSRFTIVSKKVYKIKLTKYFIKTFIYYIVSFITVMITYACSVWFNKCNIFNFGVKIIIVSLCSSVVPIILLLWTKEFKYLINKFLPKRFIYIIKKK